MNGHLVAGGGWACTYTASLPTCSHASLFQQEYQRTNRVNRTKIVRCFPHCCPRHKPRSYCGSTLLLTVTSPTLSQPLVDLHGLQVFARFRTELGPAIRVDSTLPHDFIHSSLQSLEQPTAEWVASRLVSGSGSSWVFELNPQARWLYAWDSGATKAQRRTRHLLEAIVVTPHPHQPDEFHVLATTRSPTFTFVSFRRAADVELAREPDQSLLFRALTWELKTRTQQERGHHHATAVVHPHSLKRPASEPTSWQDGFHGTPPKKALVERPPRAVEPTRQFVDSLGSVFARLEHLSARELAPILQQLEADLWQESARLSPCEPRDSRRSDAREDAACVAVRLALWFHTDSGFRGEAHGHAMRAVRWLGDPSAVHHAFEMWMVSVQRSCEGFLRGHGWPWRHLCQIVETETETIRPVPRHAFDYLSFVATVRQLAIASPTKHTLVATRMDTRVWTASIGDVVGRRAGTTRNAIDTISLASLVAFWVQLSVVHIAFVRDHDGALRIQSALATATPRTESGLLLVLDRRPRCFATLPHGEPSLGAAALSHLSLGDYIGSIRQAHAEPPVAHVTFYAWPREGDGHAVATAYRCQCALALGRDGAKQWLSARVDSAVILRYGARPSLPVETLCLSEKLAHVDEWVHAWDFRVPYQQSR